MKVTVEELSPSRRALHIELPPDRVAARLEATIRELSQKLQLPGFRKGKVPREIIQRRFEADVKEEVLRELIPDSYREALAQAALQPVSQPQVDDVQFHAGEPLRYRAVVEVKPSVEVRDYRGITLTRDKLAVADQEVDRALEYLREEAAEYVPMEGWPAVRDDLVILDHEASLHGKPFKGGSGKNLALILGREGYLPGFTEQILGMQKGEGKHFVVNVPADSPRKDLAGRAVDFRVTVKEVKKRRLPELNDEFAKSAGDVETVAALREKLRQDLLARKTREQESGLKRSLLEKLAAAHEVEVPEAMVESEAASILEEMLITLRASGGRIEGLAQDPEALRAKARDAGRRRAKESLLLEAVATQEGLTVGEAEIEAEIEAMSRAYSAGPHPAERDDPHGKGGVDVRRAMQDPARRAGLTTRLLQRKALDLLFQHATITESYNLIVPA
ncbi:MAG TPA: trigger factor [Candidatus Methylomirabilis sp.]|nr:trigger factor [Candidatus Methylomirabilis sp.]